MIRVDAQLARFLLYFQNFKLESGLLFEFAGPEFQTSQGRRMSHAIAMNETRDIKVQRTPP
jgi:hypothetical protein